MQAEAHLPAAVLQAPQDDALSDCESENSSGPRSVSSASVSRRSGGGGGGGLSAVARSNAVGDVGRAGGVVSQVELRASFLRLQQHVAQRPSAASAAAAASGAAEEWILQLKPRLPQAAQVKLQRGLCPGCQERLPAAALPGTTALFGGRRYCHYLCAYFCPNCHQGEERPIPARIAEKWDFEPRKVCCVAAKFLDKQANQPLIPITRIRCTRASSQASLTTMHRLRRQLTKLKELRDERGCLFLGMMLTGLMSDLAPHMAQGHDLYTLQDVIHLHLAGESAPFFASMARLVAAGTDHVEGCETCGADPGYCRICASERALFPFEVDSYHVCSGCGAVYHRACWERAASECPSCFAPRGAEGHCPSLRDVQPW